MAGLHIISLSESNINNYAPRGIYICQDKKKTNKKTLRIEMLKRKKKGSASFPLVAQRKVHEFNNDMN